MQRNRRKTDTAGAKLGYLDHGLMGNHYGLMTDAEVSRADGYGECTTWPRHRG